jgi:hypothetical protein
MTSSQRLDGTNFIREIDGVPAWWGNILLNAIKSAATDQV